jgi:hypothetical protein
MTQYANLEIPPPPISTSNAAPPQRKKGFARYAIIGCGGAIVLTTLFVVAIFVFVMSLMRSGEPYKESVRRMQSDVRVTAKIGSPVKPGWFVSGSINTTPTSGHADLAIPFKAPKGEATVNVVADKVAGKWKYQLMRATFEDGSTVDLVAAQAIEQSF